MHFSVMADNVSVIQARYQIVEVSTMLTIL